MLPPLATIDDVTARLGTMPDLAMAAAFLDDASELVRAETGRDWVDEAGELVDPLPPSVVVVTARAAARALRNPAEVTQQTAGPFSVTHPSGVYLTRAEQKILARVGRPQIGTLSTTRGPIETGDITVPVDGGRPMPLISRDPW